MERKGRPRIYFDTCCYGRMIDNPSHPRLRLERLAIEALFKMAERHQVRLTSSIILELEIEANLDPERKAMYLGLLTMAREYIPVTAAILRKAQAYTSVGLKRYDALHLAHAAAARCDMLVTTDDRFLRATQRLSDLAMPVVNPTEAVMRCAP